MGPYCQLHCACSAQTGDSGWRGFDEAQSFLSSLTQSRKVNTWTQFCLSFSTARLSQEQFTDDREEIPPTPHGYFKQH